MDKYTEEAIEHMREGLLQQGILISVLTDVVIENKLITRDELDVKFKETANEVDAEIKQLQKAITDKLDKEFGVDPSDDSDGDSSMFMGKGGLA